MSFPRHGLTRRKNVALYMATMILLGIFAILIYLCECRHTDRANETTDVCGTWPNINLTTTYNGLKSKNIYAYTTGALLPRRDVKTVAL